MTNIGDYIAKARIDKGYSMRKLARLSGIQNATLSKIESGKIKSPNLSMIKTLCRYLDISYEDCLYVMQLGATYNSDNTILMNYYKNISDDELKNTYKNIIGKINEYDKILLYLQQQFNKTDDKKLLIDTIKSYEYENRTNKCIRKILEEKILNKYLNS